MSIWTPPEPYKIKSNIDNSDLHHLDNVKYYPLRKLGMEEQSILNIEMIKKLFERKGSTLCNADTAAQLYLASERIVLTRNKGMHIILFLGTTIESPTGRLGIPMIKNISGTNKYFKWWIDTWPLDEPPGAISETCIAFY